MDLNELRKEKAKLEIELIDAIALRVKTFKQKTGLTPDRIDVDMMNISTATSQEMEYQIGGVHVHLDV